MSRVVLARMSRVCATSFLSSAKASAARSVGGSLVMAGAHSLPTLTASRADFRSSRMMPFFVDPTRICRASATGTPNSTSLAKR